MSSKLDKVFISHIENDELVRQYGNGQFIVSKVIGVYENELEAIEKTSVEKSENELEAIEETSVEESEKEESVVADLFGLLSKLDLSKINTGAILTGVDSLYKGGKELDLKISNYAGDLIGKMTKYIKLPSTVEDN